MTLWLIANFNYEVILFPVSRLESTCIEQQPLVTEQQKFVSLKDCSVSWWMPETLRRRYQLAMMGLHGDSNHRAGSGDAVSLASS